MKALLTFLFLFGSLYCGAQALPANTTITLKAGTSGYITINGQNYTRGQLGSIYSTRDSSLAIIYTIDRTLFVRSTRDTFFVYADSSNAKARNFNVLKTWMNTNFEYKGN